MTRQCFLWTANVGLIVLATSGCDLFGQVACTEDTDCPDAIPFCNSDVCEATADDGRPGRGVDENGCSEDADCTGGLCDIDGTFVEARACLPPEGTEDCAGDPSVSAPARDPEGPVIFALTAESIGDGCFANVTISYFDREGDVSQTSPYLAVVAGGSESAGSIGGSEDGKTLVVGTMCGGSSSTSGLLMRDGANHASNTLCLRPQ